MCIKCLFSYTCNDLLVALVGNVFYNTDAENKDTIKEQQEEEDDEVETMQEEVLVNGDGKEISNQTESESAEERESKSSSNEEESEEMET